MHYFPPSISFSWCGSQSINHPCLVEVGKANGEIKLYDHETQKLASILKKSQNPNLFDGHCNKVFSIVNHPLNPHEFISGGWDGEIHVWDARRPHSVRRIQVYVQFKMCFEVMII